MKNKKYFKYITALLICAGFALVSSSNVQKELGIINTVNASGTGGPIVLDGMDPVCHAAYGENTDQYIAKVLKSVYDQSTMPGNNGKIAILGVSSTVTAGGCGSNWTTLLNTKFLSQFSSAPTVQFITTSAELASFFSSGITSTPPKMLWIPDDWSRATTINTLFTSNAEKIADFVNSGGGLFASYNPYGWLTALLPSAVFNNGGCNGGPEATADGIADFGLSNTIVAACWHGYFTGNIGTLKTLVDYPYPSPSSTRKAVSIGGGSVTLPSSFTLAISPATPRAGEDLTITATAQTLAGVPQAGVVVTVTVSAGPDAGQTFTATTNASGVATITVRTNSVGSATYTATATVNSVAKTVSATVNWDNPTTTTAATTTTSTSTTSTTVFETSTSSSTSTTSSSVQQTTLPKPVVETTTTEIQSLPQSTVLPTTTEPVIVPDLGISSSPKTTIHDHSKHSHSENLPSTGSNSDNTIPTAILLIGLGFAIVLIKKGVNK